jgi:hypothetical protein
VFGDEDFHGALSLYLVTQPPLPFVLHFGQHREQ